MTDIFTIPSFTTHTLLSSKLAEGIHKTTRTMIIIYPCLQSSAVAMPIITAVMVTSQKKNTLLPSRDHLR